MDSSDITISAQTLLFHIQRFKERGGVLPEGSWIGGWEQYIDQLEESDERFPMRVVTQSIEFAAQQLQDPILGLNHTDREELPYSEFFRVMGYHADSLEEFIRLCSRYFCLFTEIGFFAIHHNNPETEIKFHPCDRNILSDHQIDGVLLLTVKAIYQYAGVFPIWIAVDHACPEGYEEEYEAKLGCDVSFNEPYAAVYYAFDDVTCVREATSAPLILHHLEQQRDKLYGGNLIDKTEFLIRRLLIRGEPKREQIAGELALSLRSFQRLLAQQGTTYKALLDDTRKTMAMEYVKQSNFSNQEIALLLGYSEASQFYKAFQRWFNQSPSFFRASLQK